ncbi:MAG: hypothetical protein ACSHXL_07160 [Bacteroidota bacterium]
MRLYRLTLATILQRKVWVLAILCLLLMPAVLPYLTPHDANPTLIQPARAQAAWICLWVVMVSWVFFQAAAFGSDTSQSSLGTYFLSGGVGRMSQLFQIWLACMTFAVPLIIITSLVSILGAMPTIGAEKGMWVGMNLQYASLLILVVSPLVLLAISVGSRFGGTIGYLLPFCMILYGMYGVGYLTMMTEVRDNVLIDTLYVISPHYHLADLTPRLIFKHGSMLTDDFLQLIVYFLAVKVVLTVVSVSCFKIKPVS